MYVFEFNTQIEAQPFPPIFTISLSKLQTAKCWRENLMHLSRKKVGVCNLLARRKKNRNLLARRRGRVARRRGEHCGYHSINMRREKGGGGGGC